jgi:general L-amino acid transport system substrate-binding protein
MSDMNDLPKWWAGRYRIGFTQFGQAQRFLLQCAGAAWFLLSCCAAFPAASDTLTQAKARGTLRCGVSANIPGFSARDTSGHWAGIDVDFCRAVAAAALGDANKVSFVALRASERFPALQAREIDLLVRNTTWTLVREASLKVRFAGVLFYDGQAMMVAQNSGVKTIAALKQATVCIEKGTTSVQQLADYSAEHRLNIEPLIIDAALDVADAFFAGRCRGYTGDSSQLAVARLRAPGGPNGYVILPERISKEPLGPVVRQGDEDWLTLVQGVLFALIGAEEAGITSANIESRAEEPAVQRVLGIDQALGKALGTDPRWAVRAVQSAGNYGEMFERNLGGGSLLKFERGLNRLWSQGGLMYAPPVR